MDNGLKRKSLINGLKTVITTGFPMVYFIYASRVLQPEGVGQINFAKSFVAYFVLFAMLGIVHYGTRECTKVRDDKRKLSIIAHELLSLNLITAILATSVLILVLFCSDKLRAYRYLLLINSISIILSALGMDWLYNALEKYTYITVRTFIFQSVGLICIFVFVKTEADIIKYAAIQTIATYGSYICNFIYSRKYISYRYYGGYNIARHLKPILLIFVMTLFIQVFTHLDSTMLSLMVDDTATGLYTAANRMNGAISTLIQSLVLVFMPQIAYYAKEKNYDRIKELSYTAINLVLMLSIPAMVGSYLLSEHIILLFSGAGFLDAVSTSHILCMRIVLVPLNSFLVLYLFIPLGKERWNLLSTGLAALLNFAMNSLLIPFLQQRGAAISTVAAEIIELIINLVFVSRVIKLRPLLKSFLQYITCASVIVILYAIIEDIVISKWISMIVLVITSAFAYSCILLLLHNKYAMEYIMPAYYRCTKRIGLRRRKE